VFLGYSALAVLPVLHLFRYYKVLENSLDYSLQNTMRQMLYLPLSRQEKYEARAVIDSFGQRLGDLLQAALVFIGLNLLAFEAMDFVPVAAVMAVGTLTVALLIIRERRRLLQRQESAQSEGSPAG
jgi:AAA family ATP:ADP antiporter